jgi:transposase
MEREPYPSDVSDEEWAFIAPYLTLMTLAAPQRVHELREVFDGLRYIVRTGAHWRLLPHDLPPRAAVYRQARRWLEAGSFAAIVADLRAILRLAEGREGEPSAAVFDARTLQSTPESGARAGYDGRKRKKGSKVHQAVGTLGHLLARHVTAADVDERTQVERLAAAVREATGEAVAVAYVDQGYTGERPAAEAAAQGPTDALAAPASQPPPRRFLAPRIGLALLSHDLATEGHTLVADEYAARSRKQKMHLGSMLVAERASLVGPIATHGRPHCAAWFRDIGAHPRWCRSPRRARARAV